jgi:hypothetical protein
MNGPEWPVIDRHSNTYFLDGDNYELKKILPDANHTIKKLGGDLRTIFGGENIEFKGMTLVGLNDLYLITNTSTEGWVVHVDASTGSVIESVHGGMSVFTQIPSSDTPDLSSITSDTLGNVFVFGNGYIWQVDFAGDSVTLVAGAGDWFNSSGWGTSYDPTASQPTSGVYLVVTQADARVGGTLSYLSLVGSTLYYVGDASDITLASDSYYVEALACH